MDISMDTDLLLEELPPMQDTNAVFAAGRFQPPTSGHYKIFNAMKKYIREHPEMKLSPVVIVIAGEKSSQDKEKNPLSAEERIKFMEASGHCNGFKFLTAKNSFQAQGVCRDNGYEPIVVAAGSDRAKGFIENLDKYFRDHDDEPIEHHVVPGLDRVHAAVATKKDEKSKGLDDAIKRLKNNEEVSDDEISGSLARHAAKLGYFNEFAEIVGLEKKKALAKIMYDKIRRAMGVVHDG